MLYCIYQIENIWWNPTPPAPCRARARPSLHDALTRRVVGGAVRASQGEVLDAVVTQVNKMGFFAEAGPLQIFVSNHHIPDDFSFQTSAGPMYCSEDGEVRVQKDCEVRLRVIGTRVDAAEIFALGSMKEDYLGVTADPSS